MNRLELVRARVDAVLAAMPDPTARQAAAVHLYGVSQACAMLAMRRGADAECAAAAGMLHDIATYATGCAAEHGPRGAVMAREILISIGAFTAGEIGEICTAIAVHSDKGGTHAPLGEILTDADVWQHCLFDPARLPAPHEAARFAALRTEFDLG